MREIWFCHLGVNVGFEQDGSNEQKLRPILIIKKFNNEVCWIIPLTKSKKAGPYYFPVRFVSDAESKAILSQLRLIDGKRLKYKAGYIDEQAFGDIQKRLKDFLS